MTIHHAVLRKAEKMGVSLSEDKETDMFTAHWVEKNVLTVGKGGFGKNAMAEMEAVKTIFDRLGNDFRIKNLPHDNGQIKVYNHDLSLVLDREGATPTDTLIILDQQGDKPWFTTTVPTDGAQAYKEGWTAADCPFPEPEDGDDESEEDSDFVRWNEEFDSAADASAEEEDEDKGGSVVKEEFRIRYREQGHPNHCGDWLAETLNTLILGKTHTDLENFEALCNLNNVSLAKYKREGNGWQGRLRMTGRNLLARAVWENDGVLKLPVALQFEADGVKVTELRAPGDWLAGQRFKGKKAAGTTTTPVPTPTEAQPVDQTPDQQAPEPTEQPVGDVPSVQDQLAKHKASKRKSRK